MSDSIIQFCNVSKKYESQMILSNFNLSIEKEQFLTVIGQSGCGKTTMLKLINGLLLPDEGRIYIKGKDIATIDLIQLRRNIGYQIQGVGLFPHMTIEKNIAYVPSLSKMWDKETEKSKVDELLDIVKLPVEMKKRYPSQLSGGQRQRVGIARALAAHPQILLMDEPFGAVDEITRKSLQDELVQIKHNLGITVVFVTHDIKEALKLGNQVLVMEQGKIVQLDSPKEILENPANDFVKTLIGNV